MRAYRGLFFLLLGAFSACAGRIAPTVVVVQVQDSCDREPLANIPASPVASVAPAVKVAPVVSPVAAAPLGLQGDIYFIPQGTSSLPDFSSLQKKSSFMTAELNVPVRYSTEGFPGVQGRQEWFAIDYHGAFSVETAGEYDFQLTADDGAELFIDGAKLISNDGIHGPTAKSGGVFLSAGIHQLRVPYFQGPEYHVALVLEVAPADAPFAVFNTQTPLSGASYLED